MVCRVDLESLQIGHWADSSLWVRDVPSHSSPSLAVQSAMWRSEMAFIRHVTRNVDFLTPRK